MDVELYIYDLSGGMARQLSLQLTGTFIEAIYHTSVVFGGVEYFYGHGIYRKIPGSTHHGRPIQIMPFGRTDLPLEVIEEYIESLSSIYTPEKYDLFHHNCNNFSQDLTAFLVGKDIPAKIRDLPSTFLRTPMGQMMAGMLDQNLRSMTQAPDAVSGRSVQQPARVTKQADLPNAQPHHHLQLPVLSKAATPITYRRVPSIDKLGAKLKTVQDEELVKKLIRYVKSRESKGADEAPLPSLSGFAASLSRISDKLEPENRFAMIDLLRIAAIDTRFGGWLVSDDTHLEVAIPPSADWPSLPVSLQIVTLQLACNLSVSPIFHDKIKRDGSLQTSISTLVSSCLLVPTGNVKSLAATLLFDLSTQDRDLQISRQNNAMQATELEGAQEAIVQAVIDEEQDKDVLYSLLLALGSLLFCAAPDSSVWDLCDAMELQTCLELRSQGSRFRGEPLLKEVLLLLRSRR